MTNKAVVLVVQRWLESERGWGCRPAGASVHGNMQDCKEFIQEYWDKQSNEVPDEYSRPEGNPTHVYVEDENLIELVSKSKNGAWIDNRGLRNLMMTGYVNPTMHQ